MAIKIIKQGKMTKFKKICPDCGCEFEYEQEDVKVDNSCCLTTYPPKYNTYIACPCCGKHLYHGYTETIDSCSKTHLAFFLLVEYVVVVIS